MESQLVLKRTVDLVIKALDRFAAKANWKGPASRTFCGWERACDGHGLRAGQLGDRVTQVTVRFTPERAELGRVQAVYSKGLDRSMGLSVVVAALFLTQGMLQLTIHHSAMSWYSGCVQTVLGILYVPIAWFAQLGNRLLAKPSAEIELTIDDAGIAIVEPALRIPWQRISAIRDIGEAFVAVRTFGRSIMILKRSLPDDGSALWASLDAKLTGTRYLVSGSDSKRTITNIAVRQ